MAISKIELYKSYEEADAETTAYVLQFESLRGDYERTIYLKPESSSGAHAALADTIAAGTFVTSDSIVSTAPSLVTPTCLNPHEWFVCYD
jgi:hypothetical protein